MGFAEEFSAKLLLQKKRFDVWNEVIDEIVSQTKKTTKLERENAQLNKIIQGLYYLAWVFHYLAWAHTHCIPICENDAIAYRIR